VLTSIEDTEFPGVVARPMGSFNGKSDYHYQCVRCNVDLLKVIQLGITLFSEDGEVPPANLGSELEINGGRRNGARAQDPLPHTWQFNFKFSLEDDMYSEVSIDSLKHAGVNFPGHERDGIDPFEFGALLISSGLVCDEDVKWISFHGGYDFAYVTKLLRCQALPDDEHEFKADMQKFFPSVWDIKYLMKNAIRTHSMGQVTPLDPAGAEVLQKFEQKSGLESLAENLKVKRQGSAHMAGSDSLLTGKVFFRMRDRIFGGEIGDEHMGGVWGLGLPEYNPQAGATRFNQENQNTQQNGYTNGAPSTPNNTAARPVHTPLNNSGNRGIGPMTPGGGGGVFGGFDLGPR
jgi:CCR4-NOT transcription complex subunit 7/8